MIEVCDINVKPYSHDIAFAHPLQRQWVYAFHFRVVHLAALLQLGRSLRDGGYEVGLAALDYSAILLSSGGVVGGGSLPMFVIWLGRLLPF